MKMYQRAGLALILLVLLAIQIGGVDLGSDLKPTQWALWIMAGVGLFLFLTGDD